MENPYLKFADLFYSLSPYDLQHLSECVLCKIEQVFEDKLCSKCSHIELTEKDVKFAITEAMKGIVLDLRKQELEIKRMQLQQAEALLHIDKRIVD